MMAGMGAHRTFCGGFLMLSSFCAGLRRSLPRLLLVLLDVGAMVEELSLLWWFDLATWLRGGIGLGLMEMQFRCCSLDR